MEGALTNKPSKQTQSGSPSDPSLGESPFKTGGGAGSIGQNSSTASQGESPNKTGGRTKNAGQKNGAPSPGESPFKTGGISGSGKGSSTVTTGAPPMSQKQGMAAWPLLHYGLSGILHYIAAQCYFAVAFCSRESCRGWSGGGAGTCCALSRKLFRCSHKYL